jgi:hypothetical protein
MIGIKLKVVDPRQVAADGLRLPVTEGEMARRDQDRDEAG